MKPHLAVFVGMLLALAACGDNASPCDYTEVDDSGNATVAMTEMTNLTVSDHQAHVCGNFDGGHHDDALGIVDTDTYRVDIETPGALLVEIVGLDGAAQLDDIAVQFLTTDATPAIAAVGHYDPALSDHGAYAVTLTPGPYDLQVVLYESADLSGPIGYRVRLSPMPACDALTSPNYSEASDATNGVVAVDYTKDPSFTMIASDVPEESHLTVEPGNSYMIAGMAGATGITPADLYNDRDTYAITTDDDTNELTLRLDWTGTASDLDFIVFEDQSVTPIVASNTTSTTEGELAVFGVKPGTRYWVWIGAFNGSTATPYTATMCGSHFFY